MIITSPLNPVQNDYRIKVVIKHGPRRQPSRDLEIRPLFYKNPLLLAPQIPPMFHTRKVVLKRCKSQQSIKLHRPKITLPAHIDKQRELAILCPVSVANCLGRSNTPGKITPKLKQSGIKTPKFTRSLVKNSNRRMSYNTNANTLKTVDTPRLTRQVEEYIRDTKISNPDICLMNIAQKRMGEKGEIERKLQRVMAKRTIKKVIDIKSRYQGAEPLLRNCVLTSVNILMKTMSEEEDM